MNASFIIRSVLIGRWQTVYHCSTNQFDASSVIDDLIGLPIVNVEIKRR